MNDDDLDPSRSTLLDLRLDALRRGLRQETPPASIEEALAARFRNESPSRARRRLRWMPPLALAATVVFAAWILRPAHTPAPAGPSRALAQDNGPFLALRPLDAIALERGATVVPTQFPRALLAEWGLPVAPDRAAEPVHAEMLYSAAGEPLAVRLVR